MKKVIGTTIFISLSALILLISISFLWHEKNKQLEEETFLYPIKINDTMLNVHFPENRKLDETISYRNKVEKTLEVENPTVNDVTFALKINNLEINNNFITYDALYRLSENDEYTSLLKDTTLPASGVLANNLVVKGKSKIQFKIIIYANQENENTNIKGTLTLATALSKKEILNNDMELMQNAILTMLKSKNGINEAGYYIINLNEIKEIKKKYQGFVLIDATDISELEFVFTIWNKTDFINNFNFTTKKLRNELIQKVGNVNNINFTSVCSSYTKKKCSDFKSIKYYEYGGKEIFTKYSKEVINLVKTDFNSKTHEKKVYIYDLSRDIKFNNPLKLRGYVLINNQTNPEYYLYITNNIFMISGYNWTKYGNYTSESPTIRAYNESAYNLSASSMNQVCKFTNVGPCYDILGTPVGE